MKSAFPYLFIAASQFLIINLAAGQANKPNTLQAPPANIVIDGDIKEWGDSLRYYNAEKAINFALANSKDTLYMAIRVNDRTEQMRILKSGITFSIDPKGKKKETFSITFPLNVQVAAASAAPPRTDEPGDITQKDRDELMRDRLTNLRGIRAVGFKDIEDEMMTTSNTYGFQTAVNYDQGGYLICEAAIPLKYFHADDPSKNEWAFNFKINGLKRKTPDEGADQQSSGGHGGRGGGMGGGGHGGRGGRGGSRHSEAFDSANQGEMYKSEDFWEKFYLAK